MKTHSSTLAWKIPWMEEPGSLVGSPWRCKESDTTERLHFHFSFFRFEILKIYISGVSGKLLEYFGLKS